MKQDGRRAQASKVRFVDLLVATTGVARSVRGQSHDLWRSDGGL